VYEIEDVDSRKMKIIQLTKPYGNDVIVKQLNALITFYEIVPTT